MSPISTGPRSKKSPPPPVLSDLERTAIEALRQKKARRIVLIMLGDTADWARSIIICDAPVEVHRRALREAVEQSLDTAGLWDPHTCHSESTESWTLIDLGETIVNIFSTQARGYYDLERTWSEDSNTFYFD
ncbi:MAG: ribosome silencing factor [bacterium JZ-2024 1]